MRNTCASIKVSDYLERQASEEDRQGGFDIANYLLQFPVGKVLGDENDKRSRQEAQQIHSPQPAVLIGRYDFSDIELPPRFKCYEGYEGVEL